MEDKIKQEIILDEKCGVEINKTFNILRICVSIYLVWILFTLYKQVIEFFYGASGSYIETNFVLKYKIIPIAYILEILVVLVGVYYQFSSFKIQRKAFALYDSALFVSSYKFFRKGMWLSLTATLLTVFIYLIFKFGGVTKNL
jgi:hypothetical protein